MLYCGGWIKGIVKSNLFQASTRGPLFIFEIFAFNIIIFIYKLIRLIEPFFQVTN